MLDGLIWITDAPSFQQFPADFGKLLEILLLNWLFCGVALVLCAKADLSNVHRYTWTNDSTFSGNAGDYINEGPTDYDFSNGFQVSFLARWDSMGSQNKWSRIFDFGNGPSSDNILIEQNGTPSTLSMVIEVGSTLYSLDLASAIVQSETDNWIFAVDSTGYCKVYKNGTLVAQKQLALPRNIVRNNCYVAKSNWSTDGVFQGRIANLTISGVMDISATPNINLLANRTYVGSAGDYTDVGTTDYDFSKGFQVSFLARWDSMGSQNRWSRIMDFGNGPSSDNILIEQNGTPSTLSMVIEVGSTLYSLDMTSAIVQGETDNWIFAVDSTGYCKVYKNGNLVAQKQLALPRNIVRKSCYIAKSNWSTDGVFQGRIANLTLSGVSDISNCTRVNLFNDRTFSGTAGDYKDVGTTNYSFSNGFEITFSSQWSSMGSSNNNSRILDIGNGYLSDNIIISEDNATGTLDFEIDLGNQQNKLSIPNAIVLNEIDTWKFQLDSFGCCKIYRDGVLVEQTNFVLPNSLQRSDCYLAKSNLSSDGVFQGRIANLTLNLFGSPENVTTETSSSTVSDYISTGYDAKYYKVYKDTSIDYFEAMLTRPAVSGKVLPYKIYLFDSNKKYLTSAQSGYSTDFVRAKVKTAGYFYIKVEGDPNNYNSSTAYSVQFS